MFCNAIRPPKLPRGSAQPALMSVALGAAALAHWTSMAASESSPLTPGSPQLLIPVWGRGFSWLRLPAVYLLRPKVLRNVAQSLVALHRVPVGPAAPEALQLN